LGGPSGASLFAGGQWGTSLPRELREPLLGALGRLRASVVARLAEPSQGSHRASQGLKPVFQYPSSASRSRASRAYCRQPFRNLSDYVMVRRLRLLGEADMSTNPGTPDALRAYYRSLSDEQLVDRVRQGQTEYTALAWTVLPEEIARRHTLFSLALWYGISRLRAWGQNGTSAFTEQLAIGRLRVASNGLARPS